MVARSCIRKYYVDGPSYRQIVRLIGGNARMVSRETPEPHTYVRPTTCILHRRSICRVARTATGGVPFTRGDRLPRGRAAGDLIAGAECLYPLRAEAARLADDLPPDPREIPGSGSIVISILPTTIVPGRKAQTKSSMVWSGSFIPKAKTFSMVVSAAPAPQGFSAGPPFCADSYGSAPSTAFRTNTAARR